MIHAYDKSYLSAAQKNLAGMLDYMVNDLDISLENTWKWFATSEMASRFGRGDCSVIAGKSGVELAYAVLEEVGEEQPYAKPVYSCGRSEEYWVGWALAYYQWETGIPFSDMEDIISIEEIRRLYHPYHEMDIRQLADFLNERYQKKKQESQLKTARMAAGITQAELSALSGVPLRTIQQYEQRQKNINKAQTETVLRLARTLCCRIEELMEPFAN